MACKTILVVEDDDAIRESLRQILEFEGYLVKVATNGKEAIELLKDSERPCLILLDLMMPIMNGWEFLQIHDENVGLATIPVVVVSAAGDRSKSVSGVEFIKKPVELDLLLKIVDRFCNAAVKAA